MLKVLGIWLSMLGMVSLLPVLNSTSGTDCFAAISGWCWGFEGCMLDSAYGYCSSDGELDDWNMALWGTNSCGQMC